MTIWEIGHQKNKNNCLKTLRPPIIGEFPSDKMSTFKKSYFGPFVKRVFDFFFKLA